MVRTRFAPSPTGYLHIGGVRTALFNWLLARQAGGQFILRIDDTDQQRNVMAALQPILDGFRWLGLDWDEGPDVGGPHAPYFQSQRVERHQAAVQQLLSSGHAYRDFAKPEELDSQRKAAEQAGKTFVYDRAWAAETPEAAAKFIAEGRSGVVRLKTPREGQCRFHDLVRGEVVVDWANEQDHVVQRADGTCLYHLASVVDDYDLEITHVVRAAEHLANTPRQIFIAQSLGYPLPIYAHLPVVAEPGGPAKLSKRKLDKYLKNKDFAELLATGNRIAERIQHATSAETFNPVIVDFYQVIGFLPDALLNYLLLLGWSLDDKTERFTRDEMIRAFTLERVNKSPASFDPQKLQSFQARQMSELSVDRKVELVTPFLEQAGLLKSIADRAKVPLVVAGLGDRLRIAGDILDYDYCFMDGSQLRFDMAAVKKRLQDDPQAGNAIDFWVGCLREAPEFQAKPLHDLVNGYCTAKGVKLGAVIHALRISTTGQAAGFGMFETLEILGRDETLRRLQSAKEKFVPVA